MRKGVSNFLSSVECATPGEEQRHGRPCSKKRRGDTLLEGLNRVVMRRTPVYVTFVVAGAFLVEQAVDKGVHKLWEYNNAGKRFEDIPVLGTKQLKE